MITEAALPERDVPLISEDYRFVEVAESADLPAGTRFIATLIEGESRRHFAGIPIIRGGDPI